MADLFTRLVGRTLGLAPVLQPQPISMFASGQGGVGDASSQLQSGSEASIEIQRQENSTALPSSGRGQLTPLIIQNNSALEITRLPGASIAASQPIEQLRSPNTNPVEPATNELTEAQPIEMNESRPRTEQRSSTNSVEVSKTSAFFEQVNPSSVNAEMAGQGALPESQRSAAPAQIQRSELSVNPPVPLVNQVRSISSAQAELSSNPLSEISEQRNLTPASFKLPQLNQRTVVTPKIAPLVPQASSSPVASSTGDGSSRSTPQIAPLVPQISSSPALSSIGEGSSRSGEPSLQPNSLVMLPVSSPPTIQVTIGRIEVRAVTASPPPTRQRAAPTPPQLSLQDYLKSRSGGNG